MKLLGNRQLCLFCKARELVKVERLRELLKTVLEEATMDGCNKHKMVWPISHKTYEAICKALVMRKGV